MTPEWKDAFKYAITLGDDLGMEMAIAGSPGWSESGGPWVPASQGMKKYVWSETIVHGGKAFTGKLGEPPSNTGAFQSLTIHDVAEPPLGSKPIPQYYADSVVVAYRRAADDIELQTLYPKMTTSGGEPNFALLTDGDLEKTIKIPIPASVGQSAWIQYEFEQPETVRAMTFVTHEPDPFVEALTGVSGADKVLEASNDGQHFHEVARLSAIHDFLETSAPEYTISFPQVTARYFRFAFMPTTTPPPLPNWAVGIDPASVGVIISPPPTDYEISELVLHGGARVNRWEEKAAFVPALDLYSLATPPVDANEAIAKSDIIDLPSKMHSDGTLDWTPPE